MLGPIKMFIISLKIKSQTHFEFELNALFVIPFSVSLMVSDFLNEENTEAMAETTPNQPLRLMTKLIILRGDLRLAE